MFTTVLRRKFLQLKSQVFKNPESQLNATNFKTHFLQYILIQFTSVCIYLIFLHSALILWKALKQLSTEDSILHTSFMHYRTGLWKLFRYFSKARFKNIKKQETNECKQYANQYTAVHLFCPLVKLNNVWFLKILNNSGFSICILTVTEYG